MKILASLPFIRPSVAVCFILFLTELPLSAAPFAVAKSSLQPPQVTFSEVPTGTLLNGLTINGFSFTENTSAGSATAPTGSGPGNTNNVSGDIALSLTNPVGYILTVTLATPATAFGFGYALLNGAMLPNAVTITLFDGANNLGSLGFASNPDPTFTGGFAGIGNSTPFTSAQITFSSTPLAFALDNFAAKAAATPDAGNSVLMLLVSGGALLGAKSVGRRQPT